MSAEPFPVRPVVLVVLFAAAFGWVEASVVVYLRDVYYPEGFSFPLTIIGLERLWIELARELSTIAMLAVVGMLAGRTRWQRFAHFAIAFGVWDILFYAWLKVMIDWPASMFEWDVLFLLPIPWIGPVLAPVLVSAMLITGGVMILSTERYMRFRPGWISWTTATLASLIVLWTFVQDTEAGLRSAMPQPYPYFVFGAGMILYCAALVAGLRNSRLPVGPVRD